MEDNKYCNDLVSILIRYHNDKVIDNAIDSAMGQYYVNKEIIVFDDCSDIPYKNDKVKVIRSDVNLGSGLAGDELIKNCNGKYFIFLDADDMFYSSGIISYLHRFIHSCDFVYGDLVLMKNNQFIGKWIYDFSVPDNFREAVIQRGGSGIVPFLKGLHRKKFWIDNNIKLKMNIVDDTYASIQFYEKGGRSLYLPYSIYYYNYGGGISSSEKREVAIKELLKVLREG